MMSEVFKCRRLPQCAVSASTIGWQEGHLACGKWERAADFHMASDGQI